MQLKIFIAKICLLGLMLVSSYFFFAYILTRGFVGDDYAKFTHRSSSLITGLSRAHYGIDPNTLDSVLKDVDHQGSFLNFAFEKSQSPYGEVYLEAIKQKIPPGTHSGIFIVCVSPGSFSAPNRLKTDEQILEFDAKMMIGKVKNLNAHPNFEYVRKCFGRSLYKGLLPYDHRLTTVFHENGWEEFGLESKEYTISQDDIAHWQEETIEGYTKLAKVIPESISDYRIRWFRVTLDELQRYGKVFLVRIPLHPAILELEDGIWNDFDQEMAAIAKDKNIPYLNYARTGEKYQTYDGSHLHSGSAKKFSADLAEDIKTYYSND